MVDMDCSIYMYYMSMLESSMLANITSCETANLMPLSASELALSLSNEPDLSL